MNILIIGLGSIAKKHIEAIRIIDDNIKIYALRSNQSTLTENNVENVFNLDELDIKIDFAIISNPTNLHSKFIQILAEKRIPIFIEKPALHTLNNSDYIINLVESNKIITYVACNLRFHPCIIFIKEFLKKEKKRINEVNVYCGSFLPDWRPGKDFRKIYSANTNMGGGVHLDLFHELDYISWLFGIPIKSHSIKRNVSSLNIDAIDYANYNLEYPNFTTNITLNYYRKKPKRTFELLLEDQTILIDLNKNCITDDSQNIIYSTTDFKINQTYNDQMKYFINCLKQNIEPMNSLKESIEILKIVLKNEQ